MSVAYATIIVIILKVLGLDSIMGMVEQSGVKYGIILLTVAILMPIATGKVTFQVMIDTFKTPLGITAVLVAVFTAIAGGQGVELLKTSPEIVSALIIGTMIGVFFFNGIAVGPLIASGLVYAILSIGKLFH
jgi:uncharacterized membrane protein (DUF441 family)